MRYCHIELVSFRKKFLKKLKRSLISCFQRDNKVLLIFCALLIYSVVFWKASLLRFCAQPMLRILLHFRTLHYVLTNSLAKLLETGFITDCVYSIVGTIWNNWYGLAPKTGENKTPKSNRQFFFLTKKRNKFVDENWCKFKDWFRNKLQIR